MDATGREWANSFRNQSLFHSCPLPYLQQLDTVVMNRAKCHVPGPACMSCSEAIVGCNQNWADCKVYYTQGL